MDEVNLIKTSYSLIQKDFGLEGHMCFEEAESGNDRLRRLLIARLDELLKHGFSSLLNALYRIDVSEEKVKQVIYQSDHENLSANLAVLIIERQKQKAITRLMYQQG